MRPRLVAHALLLAAASLALAGCAAFAPDYPHVEPADVPEEYTAPGAVLSVDDVARIAMFDPDVDIAVSIRAAEQHEKSIYDKWDNGADFQAYTPYVVVVQYDAIDELASEDHPNYYGLGGLLGNGEFAPALFDDGINYASVQAPCPYSVASTNGRDATWRIDCVVFLVPEGETLESVGWFGFDPYWELDFVPEGQEDFEESPILWKL
jgi:hypothetical protein